jgi:hypothetical protein
MLRPSLRFIRSACRLMNGLLAAVGTAIVSEVLMRISKEEDVVNLDELPKREVSVDEFRAAAVADQWKPDTIRVLLDFEPVPHCHLKVGGELLRIRK